MARFAAEIDPDMVPDLEALTHELEAGRRVSQPRLRFRLQVDTVGLDAVTWGGPVGPELIASLSGFRGGITGSRSAVGDPVKWALDRLGFARGSSAPSSRDVQRNYRERLREVHPDHGAEVAGAAQRIAELSEARRILIGR